MVFIWFGLWLYSIATPKTAAGTDNLPPFKSQPKPERPTQKNIPNTSQTTLW